VARPAAVGAPMPLVLAGVGIQDDDAAIAVTVADVDLVGRDVFPDLRRLPEVAGVVAAVVDTVLADLQQEGAAAAELEDLRVFRAVAGEPDVPLVIDGEAMVAVGPVVARSRSTPRLHQVA